VEVINTLA